MATRTRGDFVIAGVARTALWLVVFLPAAARAQTTVYWNGNSAWDDAAAWSGDAAGATPGAVPTASDTAFFSATSVTTGPTVGLLADRSLAALSFGGTSTGTTTLTGGGVDALLTLGAGGISMGGASAPAATIGSAVANQSVSIVVGASQTWTNDAATPLSVVNAVSRATGDTTPRTLTIGGSGATTISGSITNGGASGTVATAKTGTGTLTLSGANTYSGGTVVNAGTLALVGTMSYSGTITINNGGVLRLGASDRWGNADTGASAPLVVNAGGLVQSNNTYNTFISPTLAGGTLQCTGGASAAYPSFGLKGTVTVTGTSTSRIDVGSPGNGNNGINIGETFAGGSNLIFNVADATSSAAADLVVAAVMRNANNSDRRPSGIVKNGSGTMQLTAQNQFSGVTTVNAGVLELDFTGLATPTNIVGNNGWGGTGLVLGGGSLRMRGKAGGTSSQTFNAFTLQAGAGSLLVDPNGGTGTTVALAGITATTAGSAGLIGRAAGAGAGTVTITSTTARDATTGIYTPRLVSTDGTGYDWTTSTSVASPFTLSPLAAGGYVALASSGSDTNNSIVSAGTSLSGPVTTNTLKIASPASGQVLTLASGTTVLTAGGLLVTGSEPFTISDGTLTSGNGSGAYEMLVHQFATGALTIGSTLANNGANAVALTKAGPGVLELSGVNAYTGSTFIQSGSLVLAGSGQLNSGSYGGAIVNNGALQIATAANQTLSGAISGGGAVVKGAAGTLTLSGVSSFTGGTVVDGGVLVLSGGLSAAGTITVNDGGTFRMGGNDRWGNAATTVSAPIVINAGGLLQSNNTYNTFINPTLAGGTLQCTGGFSTTWPSFGLKGTVTVTGSSASRIDLGGSGNANNGLNIGPTTTGGGGITFQVADVTSDVAADLVVAVPMRNADNSVAMPATLVKTGAGTMRLTAVNTFTGGLTISEGTVELAGSGQLGNGSFAGPIVAGGLLRFAGPADQILSGVISGSGRLEKAGSGTLRITNANTFNGMADVTGGTLVVDGALPAGLSVGTAGWLGGTGTIGGQSTIAGTLGPGSSPGILTFDVLALGSTATTLIELPAVGTRGIDYDGITVTSAGGMTYGGTLSLGFGDSILPNDTTFDVFALGGIPAGAFSSLTSTGFYVGTWTESGGVFSLAQGDQLVTFSPSTGDVSIGAVPEPGAVALAAGGVVALVAARRRRRRRGGRSLPLGSRPYRCGPRRPETPRRRDSGDGLGQYSAVKSRVRQPAPACDFFTCANGCTKPADS